MPQLQTTCVKSLQDGTKLVRMRAAAALTRLSVLSTRVEPLLNELHNQVSPNPNPNPNPKPNPEP